jgi:hypothetical protein
MAMTGGCLCGAVRYESATGPIAARMCWCRVCQFLSCGNASMNVALPSAGLVVTGETRDYESIADSGNRMHRRFCPTCGTHLFSQAEARPGVVIVRVGTLDDPELGKPQAAIWVASAPNWACIDPTLETFPAQPPPLPAAAAPR